jgi:hypothetical protein
MKLTRDTTLFEELKTLVKENKWWKRREAMKKQ